MQAFHMTPDVIARAMEATWPPARRIAEGPWTLRDGKGGGQRVCATTADGEWSDADIPLAEAGMDRLGQSRLFQVREGETRLDAALAARGYRINDPVVIYAAPVDLLAGQVESMSVFLHWPPLAIAEDLWAEGGIGPARIAVMLRTGGPRITVLGRTDDTPSGVAFVAVSDGVAMLHALEVRKTLRRQGTAERILRASALWAQEAGAYTFAMAVTEANVPARALYERLGMEIAGRYHYRLK